MTLPSVFNLSTSPIRLAFSNASQYRHLELRGGVSDIWLPVSHVNTLVVKHAMAGWPPRDPDIEPLVINGFTFPDCQAGVTLVPFYQAIAQEVDALEFTRDQPVLIADVLNAGWLMSDMVRVPGAAPWYYGDTAGIAHAAYLAVPMCTLRANLRAAMLQHVAALGYGLDEVYRSDILVLYALVKPAE